MVAGRGNLNNNISRYASHCEALLSLFRRFTDTGSVKYGKLATKYPWIHGYYYGAVVIRRGYSNVTQRSQLTTRNDDDDDVV